MQANANLFLNVLQLSPDSYVQAVGLCVLILQTLTYRFELLFHASLLQVLGLFTLKKLSERKDNQSET